MSQQEHNLQINYVEFPATDIEATKRFYGDVFGWKFQDYGPDYTSFHDGNLAGGFNNGADPAGVGQPRTRGTLVVDLCRPPWKIFTPRYRQQAERL